MATRSNAGSSSFRDDPLKDPQEYDPETGRGSARGAGDSGRGGGSAKDRRAFARAMAGNKPSSKVEPGMGSTAASPGERSRED